MRLTLDQKAKKQRIAEKLAIRQVGKTNPKEKKGPTGEFELFKKIADQMCGDRGFVIAKHIFPNGNTGLKTINKENLTVSNMSHKIPKSRGEKYRLDPDNIEIVSRAWHHYEHTKQILKVDYPN